MVGSQIQTATKASQRNALSLSQNTKKLWPYHTRVISTMSGIHTKPKAIYHFLLMKWMLFALDACRFGTIGTNTPFTPAIKGVTNTTG